MKASDIKDPVFRAAVEAIDTGNVTELNRLVAEHPALLSERLVNGDQGYFKDPYLLYFVADNPIRMERLPANIVEVVAVLLGELKRLDVASLQEQLDYTLGLVATGRIPRECGVQLAMMDLLLDVGARPDGGLGALAHGSVAAARKLIQRGGTLTLATAVGLDRSEDVQRLLPAAGKTERLVALTVAAFHGKQKWVAFLLEKGVDPNGYPKSLEFHSHATPLHQAVSSGSLATVKLLVKGGANLMLKDKIHCGTPRHWAKYMQAQESDKAVKKRYAAIVEYFETSTL